MNTIFIKASSERKLLQDIKGLANKYGNDYELGKQVRALLNNSIDGK